MDVDDDDADLDSDDDDDEMYLKVITWYRYHRQITKKCKRPTNIWNTTNGNTIATRLTTTAKKYER